MRRKESYYDGGYSRTQRPVPSALLTTPQFQRRNYFMSPLPARLMNVCVNVHLTKSPRGKIKSLKLPSREGFRATAILSLNLAVVFIKLFRNM